MDIPGQSWEILAGFIWNGLFNPNIFPWEDPRGAVPDKTEEV